MCGRYALICNLPDLARIMGVVRRMDFAPSYNIAPGRDVPVVRQTPAGRRELSGCRWGLVPSWAKAPNIGYRMINARAETLAEKPAFRAAYRRRRCLVPADGFYEWRQAGGGKQAWFIAMRDREPFAFAGLWETWRGPDGTPLESCAIVTTEASPLMLPIHPRMPAILDEADYAAWLDPGTEDPRALAPLLRSYRGRGELIAFPVSGHVNDPRHDDPRCQAPAAPMPAA